MTAPAAPSRQQVPVHRTPTPYLHLQDRPYLLQPIDLAKPMAVDSKVGGRFKRRRRTPLSTETHGSLPDTKTNLTCRSSTR